MARQVGLLKLVGTLGDISFYKAVYGYLARTKTGVDRKTVLNDPRFQRTRENALEFGRAAKSGKLLRVAIRPFLMHAKDSMTVQRLTQRMMKVLLQAETLNPRGMRTVANGDLALLNGFDFNINARLDSIIQIGYNSTFDRIAGTAILDLQSYKPKRDIKAPNGTTHFKLLFGAAALNFDGLKFVFSSADGSMLPYDGNENPMATITTNLSANLTVPVVLVLGIVYYQQVNGELYDLESGAFNALGVVGVGREF